MKMTQSEAVEFKKRWQRVNIAEAEELRCTSMAEKLRQTAALMASVASLGWQQALEEEGKQVRERWRRIREACHVV